MRHCMRETGGFGLALRIYFRSQIAPAAQVVERRDVCDLDLEEA
jgi:hypothetical protein